MAHKIRWAPKAVDNLDDICTYIAKDSEFYAAVFVKKIMNIVKNLPDFPLSGRVVPEFNDENIRERIYGNYRIVYRLKGDWIEVVTISHSARLLEE